MSTAPNSVSSPASFIQPPSQQGNVKQQNISLGSSVTGPSPEVRKKTQTELAEAVLQKAKSWAPHTNWRQLALMICPEVTHETEIGGGEFEDSISQAVTFMSEHYGKGQFFASHIPDRVLSEIKRALLDAMQFAPYNAACDQSIPANVLETRAKAVLEKIQKQYLDAKTPIYIPISIPGGINNQGHVITLQYAEDGEDVIVTLLNRGGGCQNHPILHYTAYQRLHSYRYFPIRIPKKEFYGTNGRAAWCHLLRYMGETPNPMHKGYSGDDVYDIFCQFLTFQKSVRGDLGPQIKDLASELQVAGNCSQVAIDMVITDVLVNANISELERKKFFLNRDFCALLSAYQAFLNDSSCHIAAREILLNSAEAVSANLLDLYEKKGISEKELLSSQAAIHKIVKTAKKYTGSIASSSSASSLLSSSSSSIEILQTFPVSKALEKTIQQTKASSALSSSSFSSITDGPVDFSPPSFHPKIFSVHLEQWVQVCKKMKISDRFRFVCDCVQTLPIPKADKQDAWSGIAPTDIHQVLENLTGLIQLAMGTPIEDHAFNFNNCFFLLYPIVAIADRLNREIQPELSGYAPPFLPGPFKWKPDGFTSLSRAVDNARFTALRDYFDAIGLNKKAIFPVAPFLNVQEYARELETGSTFTDKNKQGVYHLQFLSQFLGQSHLTADKGEICRQNWLTCLPAPLQSLYYFVSLAHSLVLMHDGHFPRFESLSFAEGEMNGNGSLGLALWNGEWQVPHDTDHWHLDEPNHSFSSKQDDANYPFTILFNKYDKLTSNQAICDKDGYADLSDADFRNLLYITRQKNLSLWQAITFFSSNENIRLLENKTVQRIFTHCIFQPKFLLEQLKEEPDSLKKAFRQLIQNACNHFGEDRAQIKTNLFLLRTAIHFESFTSSDALREKTLSDYQSRLELIRKQAEKKNLPHLYEQAAFLETVKANKDPGKLFSSLFTAQIYSKNGFLYDPWLSKNDDLQENHMTPLSGHIPRLLREQAYAMYDLFLDGEKRSKICSSILAFVFKQFRTMPIAFPDANTPWQESFPRFSSGPFTIDFFKGQIEHVTFGILCFSSLDKGNTADLQNWSQEYGELFWRKGHKELTTLDGVLHYDDQTQQWSRSFGDKKRARLLEREIEDRSLFFLDGNTAYKHFLQEDASVIIYDPNQRRPYLQVKNTSEGLVAQQVDQQGETLPLTLANLDGVDRTHPFYPYTKRYTAKQVHCFVRDHGAIEELNFHHLGFKFTRNGKGLASNVHAGFYLVAEESNLALLGHTSLKTDYAKIQSELNGFEGAFILYNPDNNQWKIIIPRTPSFIQKKKDFSTEVFLDTNHDANSYYEYAFDPIEKVLKTENGIGNLQNANLVVLFKLQHDYEKALKYLRQIRISQSTSGPVFDVLYKMRDDHDYQLASVAFDLQMVLFLNQCRNLLFESRFGSQKYDYYLDGLMQWGMEKLKLYLHFTTESGFCRAPETLRLKENQKKMLLLAFRNYYESLEHKGYSSSEEKWKREQPVLSNQYNMLFSASRQTTFNPEEQRLVFYPPQFSILDQEKLGTNNEVIWAIERECFESQSSSQSTGELAYANRLSAKTVMARFPALYEKARSLKPGVLDPFDFVLHALLKVKPEYTFESFYTPAQLLFWIRHFPEQFEDLSLQGIKPGNERRTGTPFYQCVSAIYQRVWDLPKLNPSRFEELQKQLYLTAPFKIPNPIPLSVPKEAILPSPLPAIPAASSRTDLIVYAADLEKEIHRIFNSPYKTRPVLSTQEVEAAALLQLRKDAMQTLSLQPKHAELAVTLMKEVILRGDRSYLLQHRPMLSHEEQTKLIWNIQEWYRVRATLKATSMGLTLQHDSHKYPEISYYFLQTGKLPRPDQLAIYDWVMQGMIDPNSSHHRHFKMPPGAGKTDVLIPLFHLAAKRLGRMGVTCVTQPIYPVDKENLGVNLGKLGQDLCYLEVGMHMITTLTAQELEFIYSQLVDYKTEGRNLILTRSTYDALFLIRDLACQEVDANLLTNEKSDQTRQNRENKARWAQMVLNFFEEKTLLICDESHQNADPLTRAIYGTGTFLQLPESERDYLQELMKSVLENESIAKRLRLKTGQSGTPTALEWEACQKELAAIYAEKLPSSERQCIIDYWFNRNALEPIFLKKLGAGTDAQKKQASLIALTGQFLLELLPDIIQLRTDIDHARSLYEDRKFDVPCHNKLPTTAQYEDRYKAALLTIKGTFHRGLRWEDLKEILLEMQKMHKIELREYSANETPSNIVFASWVSGTPLQDLRLQNIVWEDSSLLSRLGECLQRHPAVIAQYLKQSCLPGIGTPSLQLTCTTTDFFNGFSHVIAFSGTPRDDLSYPRVFRKGIDFHKESAFEAGIEYCLSQSKNQTIVGVKNPSTALSDLARGHSSIFEKITVLIDPRGYLAGSNETIANDWMNANPKLLGVVYCRESRSLKVDREEKLCLHLRDGRKIDLIGSDLQTKLDQLKIDRKWIGTLYDAPRTESTHIDQDPDAKALFFINDGLTTSHTYQAAMRMRGLLTKNQSIVWAYPEDLGNQILKTENGPADRKAWTDANEQEQEKKRIILNAFQEIYDLFARPIRKEMKRLCQTSVQQMIALYQKFREGLIERTMENAYLAFREHEKLLPTGAALDQFVKQTMQRFQGINLTSENLQTIREIIEGVQSKIPHILGHGGSISRQIEQHQMLKSHSHNQTQRQQENETPRRSEIVPLDETPEGNVRIHDSDWAQLPKTTARALLKSDFLTGNCYLTQDQIRTANLVQGGTQEGQILKPIYFFLIFIKKGYFGRNTIWAEAESNPILSTVIQDLKNCGTDCKPGFSAFLVNSNGDLVQKGHGALAPPEPLVKELLASDWLADLAIDAALLRGQIHNPDNRLLKRVLQQGWSAFEALWKNILLTLPNPETAQKRRFADLKQQVLSQQS